MAHSPDESKYNEYLKPIGHLTGPLWMPFWEPSELEALRAKLFEGKVTHMEVGPFDRSRLHTVGLTLTVDRVLHV